MACGSLLFRELLAFAEKHDSVDAPVVLSGDLNAQDCDELAGLERALVILAAAPAHPLLWSVVDVPTPPTTKTDARCMRIDYLLYQSAKLSLVTVEQVPRLDRPIPNAVIPSDHVPVLSRFELRSRTAQIESAARQWLNAISEQSTQRPLSDTELRMAFDFFDTAREGRVYWPALVKGCALLEVPGVQAVSAGRVV